MGSPMTADPDHEPAGPEAQGELRGIGADPDDLLTRAFVGAARLLTRYHRHSIVGLEVIERLIEERRRVVIVGNHALEIVGALMFCAALFERTGRAPHFIGHEKGWFQIPVLRDLSAHFGVLPSRQLERTVEAVRRDGLLMLYPGANREAALRSYRDEPYRLKWEGRKGFLRVALEADAEIVFVASLGADEAYYQSSLPTPGALLRWANAGDDRYRGARLGFGLTGPHLVPGLFPLPVRIRHVVSEPLELGDRERARRDPRTFEALHGELAERCQKLLDLAVAGRDEHDDRLDRTIRSGQRWLQRLGL
jgi:1-acyl-sn-glycerol-3-phosphate acyltransferase